MAMRALPCRGKGHASFRCKLSLLFFAHCLLTLSVLPFAFCFPQRAHLEGRRPVSCHREAPQDAAHLGIERAVTGRLRGLSPAASDRGPARIVHDARAVRVRYHRGARPGRRRRGDGEGGGIYRGRRVMDSCVLWRRRERQGVARSLAAFPRMTIHRIFLGGPARI